MLAQDPRTIFIGQQVVFPGSFMFQTLVNVPERKKLECPVFEDTQMGMSIGLALKGFIPVSIFPRFDFLLLATNQLVNHLDKLTEFTQGQYEAKVIIRVGVGSTKPFYPGVQHCQDYSEAFKHLLKSVHVMTLDKPKDIVPLYDWALHASGSFLMVEKGDNYAMEQ